jgi:hypothetical protein
MRRSVIALACAYLLPASLSAQYLSPHAVLYQDPSTVPNWQLTPLALGKTTLQSARRMFPEAPKVLEGRGPFSINDGNPAPIDRWDATNTTGGVTLTAKYLFDLGPGRWSLYFDANQRLIYSVAPPEVMKGVTRPDFTRHYPQLKAVRGEKSVTMEGPVSDCVYLTALFFNADTLQSYSYTYTCPTTPAPHT